MRCVSSSSMLASGGCQDGNTQIRRSDEEDDVAANDRGVADYGIDAPGVVRNLALGGVAAFVVGVGSYHALRSSHKVLATVVRTIGYIGGANLLLVALMLLSSKVGKFREREWGEGEGRRRSG